MKRGFDTIIRLVFVVAATLLLFPSQGAAQHVDLVDHDGFHLDHFKCYATHSWPPKHVGVGLQDQFDVLDWSGDQTPDLHGHEWHQVEFPVQFCNPVGKRVRDEQGNPVTTPITDRDAHLLMYDTAAFELPKKTRLVLYSNQFNRLDCDRDDIPDCGFAFVSDAHVLAVPTQKQGHDWPDGLDHYKCYPADPLTPANEPALLRDEFHTERVSVLWPVLFCNPTRKFHNGVITEIVNADDHLVCYKIVSHGETEPAPSHVGVANQFERSTLPIGEADALCVPSKKLFFFDLEVLLRDGAAISGLPAEVESLLGALQGQ